MSEIKIKTYMGVTILPVSYQASRESGYRWWVPRPHITGMSYGEMDSRRYYTLAEAKADIRQSRAASR